jgi:cell wall-associated NlpC family hydrolase
VKPEALIAAARELLEMPFRHQGRSPSGKTDCAGVICHVAARNNIQHEDQNDYPRLPGGSRLEAALDGQEYLVRVPIANIQAGDVLLMKFTGDPQHLGLYTGENIIHAYESVGKVVEHGLTADWQRRIVRAYRFVGVEA